MTPTPGSRPNTTCKASTDPAHGHRPRRHARLGAADAAPPPSSRRCRSRHRAATPPRTTRWLLPESQEAISAALGPGRRAPEIGHRRPGRRRKRRIPARARTQVAAGGLRGTRKSPIARPVRGCPLSATPASSSPGQRSAHPKLSEATIQEVSSRTDQGDGQQRVPSGRVAAPLTRVEIEFGGRGQDGRAATACRS